MTRVLRWAADQSVAVPLGAAIALAWSNLDAERYYRMAGGLAFWVNDVGMALFFALIMQEVLEATMPGGALHTWQRAILPIIAGLGGLIGAVAAYEAYVFAGDEHVLAVGWPIVCAIDGGIAYSLVRFLLGPGSARPFLLLMVIASNAVGLVVIGLHQQGAGVHPAGPLLIAAGLAVGVALKRMKPPAVWVPFIVGGAMLWWGFWLSGLHPALALVPIVPFLPHSPRGLDVFVEPLTGTHAKGAHLEALLRIPVQVVLFLFALVNAGVLAHGIEPGAWAVPAGALLGRPLGILAAVALSMSLGLRLPHRLGFSEVVVVALAASTSFTFGLFFATGVFPVGALLMEAKVGAWSTILGVPLAIGAAWLLRVGRFHRPDAVGESRQEAH